MPVTPQVNESLNIGVTLLSEVTEVSDEEISTLRDKFGEEFVEAFDSIPRHKQAVLVALYRREFHQLVALADTRTYFVGLHDLRNELHFLLYGVPDLSERWQEEKKSQKK